MEPQNSFLDLASVRVAVIPTRDLSGQRYQELASYISSFRRFPASSLPRRSSTTPRSFRSIPRYNTNADGPSSVISRRGSLYGSSLRTELSLEASEDGPPSTNNADMNTASVATSNGTALGKGRPDASEADSRSDGAAAPPTSVTSTTTKKDTLSSGIKFASSLASKRSFSLKSTTRMLSRSHTRSSTIASLSAISPARNAAKDAPFASQSSLASQLSIAESEDLQTLDPEAVVKFRYDLIPKDRSGRLRKLPYNPWDEFHAQKAWGVVGIVEYSLDHQKAGLSFEEVVEEAKTEFAASCKEFKSSCVWRLIIFTSDNHHSSDFVSDVAMKPAVSKSRTKSSDAFVNEIKEDESRMVSIGQVQIWKEAESTKKEVRAQVIDFASLVMSAIEDWMKDFRFSPTPIVSPLDMKRFTDKKKLSKRNPGRLDKIEGDYYLLIGSSSKALAKYEYAVEKARSNSDRLWTAGAMEGTCAASVWSHLEKGKKLDDEEIVLKIISRYEEIQRLYEKKKVSRLEISSAMRLAEYLAVCKKRRKDTLDAVSRAAHVLELSSSLTVVERAFWWGRLAKVCTKVKANRKAASFLYRLVEHNISEEHYSAAHMLISACLSLASESHSLDTYRSLVLEAANIASLSYDYEAAARHLVSALSLSSSLLYSPDITDSEVSRLLHLVDANRSNNIRESVIQLADVCPRQDETLSVSVGPGAEPTPRADSSSRKVFLFNPYEVYRAAKNRCMWIREEAGLISVILKNCTKIPISADILTVLLTADDSKTEKEESNRESRREASEADDVHMPVGKLLDDSSKHVEFLPRRVLVEPHDECSVQVEVRPQVEGHYSVRGVVLRIFGDIITLLKSTAPEKGKKSPATSEHVNRVTILPPLSEFRISAFLGDSTTVNPSIPVQLYQGEKRRLKFTMTRIGREKLETADLRLEMPSGIVNLVAPGLSRAKEIVPTLDDGEQVDFEVEFTGIKIGTEYCTVKAEHSVVHTGIVRTNSFQVRITVHEVVKIQLATISATDTPKTLENVVQLTNRVCTPLNVTLLNSTNGGDRLHDRGVPLLETLEHGCCVTVPRAAWPCSKAKESSIYWQAAVWNREGIIVLNTAQEDEVQDHILSSSVSLIANLEDDDKGAQESTQRSWTTSFKVSPGKFYTCHLSLKGIDRKDDGFVDLRAYQEDGRESTKAVRNVDIVGMTERVPIAVMAGGITVLLRWNSCGEYYIEASIFAQDAFYSQAHDFKVLEQQMRPAISPHVEKKAKNERDEQALQEIEMPGSERLEIIGRHIGQLPPPRRTVRRASSRVFVHVQSRDKR